MSVTEQLKTQKFHFETVLSQGTYSYTVRVDNLYQTNDVYVETIDTPNGPFIEDIPLPENVVRDMVNSMDSILGENVPIISLDGVALVFEATETGENPDSQEVNVSNIGSFGSLLDVDLEPDESWVTVSPDAVGNIAKDEEEPVTIQALTGNLVAVAGNDTLNDTSTIKVIEKTKTIEIWANTTLDLELENAFP